MVPTQSRQILDENGNKMPLPDCAQAEGPCNEPISLTLAQQSGDNNNGEYRLSVTIGNTIQGSLTVSDTNRASVAEPLMSTAMATYGEVFELEQLFQSLLPQTVGIGLVGRNMMLATPKELMVLKKQ